MGYKAAAPVLWNENGDYLNNTLVGIDSRAQVVGIVSKPVSPYIPPFSGEVSYQDTLYLKDPIFGGLYVNLTWAQWLALIGQASVSPGNTVSVTYTIPTDKPAGSTLADAALLNAKISAIFLNGIAMDIRTITFTNSATQGILTFPTPLADGDTVSVVYYTN